MARKFSRRIVIDTDIARSAGETDHPRSVTCREFLQAVVQICHRVVVTPDILFEWEKHRSRFTSRWLAAMAQKGKAVECEPAKMTDLREQFANDEIEKGSQAEAMLKDIHLIEAAIVNDRLVASLDENARQMFHNLASTSSKDLQSIVWVNPERSEDSAITWLREGAADVADRRLGVPET